MLTITIVAVLFGAGANGAVDYLQGEKAEFCRTVEGGEICRGVKIKTAQGQPYFEIDGRKVWLKGQPLQTASVPVQVSFNWSP